MGGIICNYSKNNDDKYINFIENNPDIKEKIKNIFEKENEIYKNKYKSRIEYIIKLLKDNKQDKYTGKVINANLECINYYIKKYYFNPKEYNYRHLSNEEYEILMNKIRILKIHSTKDMNFQITEGYVNQGNQYLFQIVYNNLRLIYKTYNLYGMTFPETPI